MSTRQQPGRLHSPIGLACLLALLCPTLSHAAWLGYKNDTNAVVVIQSATVVNGQVRRGKPHTLFPGEVAWDAIPTPGARTVTVHDPKRNNQLVLQDMINVGSVDIVLSLQLVVPAAVKGQPQQPPRPVLIPIKVPVIPPGGAGTTPTPTIPLMPGQPRTTPIPPRPPNAPPATPPPGPKPGSP